MHFSKQRGFKIGLFGATAFVAVAFTNFAQADVYEVKSGDTLSEIAKKHERTVDYLVAVNKIENPDLIMAGQKLELGDGKTIPAVKPAPASTPAVAALSAPVAAAPSYDNSNAYAYTYYSEPVAAPVAPAASYGGYNSGVVLANGNTAGEVGAYAAAQMEAATGVSASTWEHIIARESNGQVNAYNPSGASGLFQTMPGWGSTATVEDQIQSALNAYNMQGLSAWGY